MIPDRGSDGIGLGLTVCLLLEDEVDHETVRPFVLCRAEDVKGLGLAVQPVASEFGGLGPS